MPEAAPIGKRMVKESAPLLRKANQYLADTQDMNAIIALLAKTITDNMAKGLPALIKYPEPWCVRGRATRSDGDPMPSRWPKERTKLLLDTIKLPEDDRKDFKVEWDTPRYSNEIRVRITRLDDAAPADV